MRMRLRTVGIIPYRLLRTLLNRIKLDIHTLQMYLIESKMSEFVLSGITKPEDRQHLFDETEKDIASSMYVTIGYECTLSTTKCRATPKLIL
jgi:hypothetical protein